MTLKVATITLLLLLVSAMADTINIPPTIYNGSVAIETLSIPGNLDGFKVRTAANLTSYDYWWLDFVSTTDDTALNIVFYNAGNIGNSQPVAVEVSGVLANGTRFFNHTLAPYGAVISNGSDGVFGHWVGIGATFRGTNLDKLM